jgi:hypothetical protein
MQRFIAYVVENTSKDISPLLTKDVLPSQRDALDAALRDAAARVRSGKASIESVAPFLRTIQDVTADRSVDRAEVEKLIKQAKSIKR